MNRRVLPLRRVGPATVLLVAALVTAACSGLSVGAARQLAVTGRETAVLAKQTSVVSEKDYARALDGEAMQHGASGNLEKLEEIVTTYDDVRRELANRAIVFDRLADLYDAFGDLAGIDAAHEVETAIGKLNGAIGDYAKQMKLTPPVSSDATNAIATIGGLVAAEIQKAKLKKASALIRGELEQFAKLLDNPLVRTQVTGFRRLLQQDAAAGLIILWEGGALDPKPLLDDMGSPAGLAAAKEAQQVLTSKPLLKNGLTAVLRQRLSRQSDLIDQGYAASLQALNRLAREHKKLEEEQPLDLARLREVVGQLRTVVELLTRIRAGVAG